MNAKLLVEEGARKLGLTPRQVKIVGLMSQGLDTKEIASAMNLSRHTISAHLRLAFEKLDVTNRVSLAMICVVKGIGEHK